MGPDLEDAVETAYRVFARGTIGPRLNVCRCGVCFGRNPDMEGALVATPLREVSAVALAEYTNSAHEWDEQMLYFLPRYFDLIAAGEIPANGAMDYALARLSRANWRATWPMVERLAVEGFFAACLIECLHGDAPIRAWWGLKGHFDPYYCGSPLRHILCMIVNADGDLAAALELIDNASGLGPRLHLAALINDAAVQLSNYKLGWPTLGRDSSAEDQIVDWMLQTETLEAIDSAYDEASQAIDRNTFASARSVLEGASRALLRLRS